MSRVLDALEQRLKAKRDEILEGLGAGAASTYEDYRELVGGFKMLNHVLAEIGETVADETRKDLE